MVEVFANSGDPDQMPRSVASDLGLHCLPITLLGSSDYNRLKKTVAVRNLVKLDLILLFLRNYLYHYVQTSILNKDGKLA